MILKKLLAAFLRPTESPTLRFDDPLWSDELVSELARLYRLPPDDLRLELYITDATVSRKIQFSPGAQRYTLLARALRRLLANRSEDQAEPDVLVPVRGPVTLTLPPESNFAGLDRALAKLEAYAPRRARIAELHCYIGLTLEEIAALIETPVREIQRDWHLSMTFLGQALQQDHGL